MMQGGRDLDMQQVILALENRMRPLFRTYLSAFEGTVEEVGTGDETGYVKVRRPAEDIPTADLLWSKVYGAVPSVGANVLTLVSVTGNRRVITGGGGSGGGGGPVAWTDITGKPATFPPDLTAHLAAGDPHPGYLTPAEADLVYKAIGYVPSWTEITGKPSTFTPSAHSHTSMTDLGSGTPAAGKYLDGGGSWTTLPAGGSGSAANPITDPEWFDDFVAGGSGTGDIGAMGWETGGGTSTQTGGEANHPGIFTRTTAATAGTAATLYLRGAAAFVPAESFDMTFSFRISSLFATANSTIRFGLLDVSGATVPANGIYLERLAGEATLEGWFVCRAAGTQTRVSAGTLVQGNWHKVRIRRASGTQIGFTIDGGTETLISTNVPTLGLFPCFQYRTESATARPYEVDYWTLKINGLVR